MDKIYLIILPIIFLTFGCENSDEYRQKAANLEKQEKFEEAIPELDKLIELEPENTPAIMDRGVDKSMIGDYVGAIDDYNKILEIEPKNELAILNKAKNLNRLERYHEALNVLNDLMKRKNSFQISIQWPGENQTEQKVEISQVHYERGIVFYNIDSLKRAFDDFSYCVTNNESKAASLWFRANIYFAYGNDPDACEDIRLSHQLGDPDAEELINKFCGNDLPTINKANTPP